MASYTKLPKHDTDTPPPGGTPGPDRAVEVGQVLLPEGKVVRPVAKVRLVIVRHVSPYMLRKQSTRAQATTAGGQTTLAAAMDTETHLLDYDVAKPSDIVNAEKVVMQANRRLLSDPVIESLRVSGRELGKFDGRSWAELAKAKGDPSKVEGERIIKLLAKLDSSDKQVFNRVSSIIRADKFDTTLDPDLKARGVPVCAVDPLSLTVPIRVKFRLRDINADIAAQSFRASFCLELQWVEGPDPSGLARSKSELANENLPKLDPALIFANAIELDTLLQSPRTDVTTGMTKPQLQRFWGVNSDKFETENVYKQFRQTWNGSGVFSIDNRADVPAEPATQVKLTIKLLCGKSTPHSTRTARSARECANIYALRACVCCRVSILEGHISVHNEWADEAKSCSKRWTVGLALR